MNSLLMTAGNGQKTYTGMKTQTRRILSESAQSILNDLAGDRADPAPLTIEYVTNCEREGDDGKPYRYTGFVAWLTEYPDEGAIEVPCPFRVGERRYIREPHYLYGRWKWDGKTKTGKPKYRFIADRSKGACYPDNPPPRVCTRKSAVGWFRRPGIFMFEWAARTIVEITEVRIQRVQDISADDAIDEGADMPLVPREQGGLEATRERIRTIAFPALWDSPAIHGAGAWERNDWVAAVTYRRVRR